MIAAVVVWDAQRLLYCHNYRRKTAGKEG